MWLWTAVYSKWVCTADVSVQQCTVNVIVYSKCESVSRGVQQLCCHPHSPFLLRWHLSLVGAVTSIIFVATKVLSSQNMSFRHNKTFVAKTLFCHNKTFLVTNICSEKQFCCDTFCYDKSMLVRTKLLLRQNSLLLQIFVATRVISVMTNMCLLWQKFCCDKTDTCGISRQWYLSAARKCLHSPKTPTSAYRSIFSWMGWMVHLEG